VGLSIFSCTAATLATRYIIQLQIIHIQRANTSMNDCIERHLRPEILLQLYTCIKTILVFWIVS